MQKLGEGVFWSLGGGKRGEWSLGGVGGGTRYGDCCGSLFMRSQDYAVSFGNMWVDQKSWSIY